MGLALKVVNIDSKEELVEPYLLRISGWTEERYFKEAPETGFVEFEDGEIIMHSPVNTRHQEIVGFLTFLLRGYISKYNLGKVLNGPAVVRLRPNLDYEPDIFIITTGQIDHLKDEYYLGAPVMIVEVISHASRNHDLKNKADNYRRCGVKEYWAIDPGRRILYRHTLPTTPNESYHVQEQSEGRLKSQTISGFWLDLSWLWLEGLPEELICLEKILRQ